MTDDNGYVTFKGLTTTILFVAFMIVGGPVLLTMAMLGTDEYAEQCNLSPLPCFGLEDTR
jgi:hypothetical protein